VLRAALRAHAVSPDQLLERIDAVSVTREVDAAKEALRGQVPQGALRGLTDALSISYERLKPAEQHAARLLAQLGPEAIPQRIIDSFGDAFSSPVQAALVARAWVTSTSAMDGIAADAVPLFGRMHLVVADFLRAQSSDPDADRAVARRTLLAAMTDTDNPSAWAALNRCVPHAEAISRRANWLDTAKTRETETAVFGLRIARLWQAVLNRCIPHAKTISRRASLNLPPIWTPDSRKTVYPWAFIELTISRL
jgi:hypothetical protein